MKNHKFWAWAAVFCILMTMYTGYKHNEKILGGFAMFDFVEKIGGKRMGIFAAGVLFGTAGVKLLSSKDAKKCYTNCTAAVLRAKDCVMKTVTTIQENAEDIYAEAQQINEDRAAREEAAVCEDEAEQDAGVPESAAEL